MRNLRNTVRAILMVAVASAFPRVLPAADVSTPEPVARAVVALAVETSEPEIGGFRWGSPIAALAASAQVKASPTFSARCVADIQSADRADCRAFVANSEGGFAHVFYATSRDGLLMVESHPTHFDCARFEDMASPAAGHRAALAKLGWNYLRRDRRPEGADSIVETQLFVRNGIGVELTFIKTDRADGCGMKSYVSKMM
jgi:hypothetical protein